VVKAQYTTFDLETLAHKGLIIVVLSDFQFGWIDAGYWKHSYGVINYSGKAVIPLKYDMFDAKIFSPHEKILTGIIVKRKFKSVFLPDEYTIEKADYGVVDYSGKEIALVPTKTDISALAGKGIEKSVYDFIDVVADKENPVNKISDGIVRVQRNNKISFIDVVTGKEIASAGKIAETPTIRLGALIGTIGNIEGGEITVSGKDTIGRQAPMGRMLIVDANGQYIYLQSSFPMQTIVKCKIIGGDRTQLKKGMKVYLKP